MSSLRIRDEIDVDIVLASGFIHQSECGNRAFRELGDNNADLISTSTVLIVRVGRLLLIVFRVLLAVQNELPTSLGDD